MRNTRFIVGLLCLILTGCGQRKISDVGPQPSDTIIAQPWQPEVRREIRVEKENKNLVPRKQTLETSEEKIFGGLYNPQDVALSIYFDFDKFTVPQKSQASLEAVVKHLQENEQATLLIAGHCDWFGTSDYNLRLGEKRANAVEGFLKKYGIVNKRIEILSLGSLYATKGLDKTASWPDRRCDLVLFPLK